MEAVGRLIHGSCREADSWKLGSLGKLDEEDRAEAGV
jgi:hypothetical protein